MANAVISKLLTNYTDVTIGGSSASHFRTTYWERDLFISDFDLVIVLSHSMQITFHQYTYCVKPGEFCLITPKTAVHFCGFGSYVDSLAIHFSFPDDETANLFRALAPSYGNLGALWNRIAFDLLDCYSPSGSLIPEKLIKLKGILLLFLDHLLSIPTQNQLPADSDFILLHIIVHLQTNLSKPLTSTSVCSALGFTKRALDTYLLEKRGQHLAAFIRSFKLNEAYTRLAAGASVKETAYAVGYSNPFTFSRASREHFGIPPTQVRLLGSP